MNTRSALALLRTSFAGVLLVAVVAIAPAVRAQDSTEAVFPDFVGYVNDRAGVMDEPSRAKLESFLDQLHKKTGAQMAVLTVKTTAPLDPNEYKVKVFERWKIGDKERDDGLLMLVALDERAVRFETGYGLEGTLPDGLQSRLFRNVMAPKFREGDYTGGITQGVLQCAARIAKEKGVTLEWDGSELRYGDDESSGGFPPLLLALIVFIILSIVLSAASSRGRYRRYGGWGGGFGGGMGGWGGGFGGGGFGGGGFGGGGGGGGSFGGFGGGSSGGGGGGGNW